MKLDPGTIVDRKYEVLATLGEGGMGAVHRARHVLTEQIVALKVLDVTTGDEGKARRFKLEVSVAAKVKHPAIVKVSDAGVEWDEGRYYLAMELLEGRSLRDAMEDEDEPARRCVEHLRDALDAMVAAHAAGVVHRDLKPDNLFLERGDDGAERLRVLDFGIARDIREASRTTTGVAVGTALYMSPEQATADKGAGPAADIWACGAMLYQILTGELPFDGASAHAVVVDAVTRPHRPVSALRPELAPGWSPLVDACLAKKPSERPTAEELRDALTTLLADEAPANVSAPVPLGGGSADGVGVARGGSDAELAATEAAPSTARPSTEAGGRSRGPILAAAALAIAAVVGLGGWAALGSTSEPRSRTPAAAPPLADSPPEAADEIDEVDVESAPRPEPTPVTAPVRAVRTVGYDSEPAPERERPARTAPRPPPADPPLREPAPAEAPEPPPAPEPEAPPEPEVAPIEEPEPAPAPGSGVLQGTDAFDRQARRRRP